MKERKKKSQKEQDVKLQVRRKMPSQWDNQLELKETVGRSKETFCRRSAECRTKLELCAWSVLQNSAPQPES